jgi:AcrR family transcriptional regulator
MTGLRERKRARTHAVISDTAIALFLEHGFDQVSVAQVAEAAEVSKRTVFAYFPTKEDLVVHRFADHETEAARVVRARPLDGSPCPDCASGGHPGGGHALAAVDGQLPGADRRPVR